MKSPNIRGAARIVGILPVALIPAVGICQIKPEVQAALDIAKSIQICTTKQLSVLPKPQKEISSESFNGALSTCLSTNTPPSIKGIASSVEASVSLATESEESNSSWDSHERNRISKAFTDALYIELNKARHLYASNNGSREYPKYKIVLNFKYGPSKYSNRTLDQWISIPKVFSVDLDLLESGTRQKLIYRNSLSFKTALSVKHRSGFNSDTSWYKEYIAVAQNISRKLIADLDQQTPYLNAAVTENGTLIIETSGYRFPEKETNLLLIPLRDSASTEWLVGKLRQNSLGSEQPIQLLYGETEACSSGCRAYVF